jgi:hypothetical protein
LRVHSALPNQPLPLLDPEVPHARAVCESASEDHGAAFCCFGGLVEISPRCFFDNFPYVFQGKLGFAVVGQQAVGLLLDVGRLGVDEAADVAAVHYCVAESGEAGEEVGGVGGGGVAPAVFGLLDLLDLGGLVVAGDVYAAEFGAEDWGCGVVGAAGVCLAFGLRASLEGWEEDGAAGGGD